MKIFNPAHAPTSSSAPAAKVAKKGHVPKKELSANDIRQKLAANAEISEAAKAKAKVAQESQKLGEGFMKDPADHVLKSDVQVNDPGDPVTTEKLKTVLQKGAFSFNPKERDVLDKILGDS